jgi:hypothetical protein
MFQVPTSIAKSRRRRQIRVKLDEVSRVMGTHFRGGATDCALITADGDLLTAKGVSTRPFVPLVPKVRALRESATAVSAALAAPPPRTVHVRGAAWTAAVHSLGPHTLVAYTPVPLGTPDAVLRNVDLALAAGGSSPGPIADLARLVQDLS